MKVVIFCGGLGMRLREYAENVPKPMVPIGYRPILWHLMKYYAHFGHKDFILCLGYRADVIKNYFLNYSECASNDFTLSQGGKNVNLYSTDIDDWKITFADTGITSNVGQRLKAVERYLEGEEMFLANYCDGLTDLHLPNLIDFAKRQNRTAAFLSARPRLSYHTVVTDKEGIVTDIKEISQTSMRINAGYFVFRHEIFDCIRPGEELVYEPFSRLIEQKQLVAYPYDGFLSSMDTFKDKQTLDDVYAGGNAPWELWKSNLSGQAPHATPAVISQNKI